MSLRAILSGSRVKKRPAAAAAAGASRKKKAPAAATSPWPTSLRQTKPGPRPGKQKEGGEGGEGEDEDEEEEEEDADDGDELDYLGKLDDSGLVASLADDLTLRDVVQALRYARDSMFEPLPQQYRPTGDQGTDEGGGGGYVGNSARVAALLDMRRRMPPLATTAHVAALLPNATATERETVALVRAGVLRKVVQPQWQRGFGGGGGRRGAAGRGGDTAATDRRRALALGGQALGEVLVETAALQRLVREGPSAGGLGAATRTAFCAWLGGEETADAGDAGDARFAINGRPAPALTAPMADELVRAGFLVGPGAAASHLSSVSVTGGHRSASSEKGRGGGGGGGSDTGDVFARPEDRTTLLSLETVARAASGSYEAVGGVGAVYAAGGGGARGTTRSGRGGGGARAAGAAEDLRLAVPGHGTFVKLVSGALAHLVGLLARTPYREALETTLRERWDAGGGSGGGGRRRQQQQRTSYGGIAGPAARRVPHSRTQKWKAFYGLRFDWVLAEAVGAGLVELFDTGSVGRGVRLLS